MRKLKLVLMLVTFASILAAGPGAGQKKEPDHLRGEVFSKEMTLPDRVLRAIEDSKTPKIDPLGPLGELPPALEVDADILKDADLIDEQARDLACQVLFRDESALPALLAAMRLSGLHVRNGTRGLVSPVGRSQGLVVDAWEVQAMGRLVREGFVVGLPDVAQWISGTLKIKDSGIFEQGILASIRKRAAAEPGPVRFWGRFVVELGRQSRYHPVDLLAEKMSPTLVRLDAVQLALVLNRLAGDFWAYSNAKDARASRPKTPAGFNGRRSRESFFVLCSAPVFTSQALAPSHTPSGTPCPGNMMDGTIADAMAVDITKAADVSLDRALDTALTSGNQTLFSRLSKVQTGISIANNILAYLKLAMAYASFEIEFSMKDPPPLKRTRSTSTPDDKTTLTLHAVMNPGKLDWINCARFILNFGGIDFNVEKNGALDGSTVNWRVLSGGDMVQFYGSDIVHGITDDEGNASVGIEGCPQKIQLSKLAAQVKRRAVVNAQVSIKPTHLGQDLVDGVAAALGGLPSVPAEVLYRTGFGFDRSYAFDVLDWTDNLKFTLDSALDESNETGGSKIWVNGHFKAEVELKPDCKEGDNACGKFWGKGTLQVVQPWMYTSPGESCTIEPNEKVPVEVRFESDKQAVAVYLGADTDKWRCTPGPRGEGWWLLQFLLFHHEDLQRGEDAAWYVWYAETIPAAGILFHQEFHQSQNNAGDRISEHTKIQIRRPE